MFCTQCGTQSSLGANFCAKCGIALSAITGQQTDSPSNGSVAGSSRVVPSERKKRPSGFGGWLALLIVGMMFLGPLLGAGRINADIMTGERQYPVLISLDEWKTFKSLTWCTFLGFAALSFYGGWGLARGKDWSVVNRARTILWITGPIASIVLGVLIPMMTFGKAEGGGEVTVALITSVIVASIWTAYLSKIKVCSRYVSIWSYCNEAIE